MKSENKIAIFRSSLLALSETFIRTPISYYKTWSPTLVGINTIPNSIDLSSIRHISIHKESRSNILSLFRTIALRRNPHIATLQRHLKKGNYKLIHIHFGTDLFLYWNAFRGMSIPIVTTLHGFDVNIKKDEWESGKFGEQMKSYCETIKSIAKLQNISFIAVSDSIKHAAIEMGIPKDKIKTLYLGIDINNFCPGKNVKDGNSTIISFVGRLVEKKGLIHLLKAIKIVSSKYPDIHLNIIGDGPLRSQYADFAKSNKLPVSFLGAQPSEIVRKIFHESDIFCLPSVTAENGDAEGLPIVILEAQSTALPVITSARGGATEAIEHAVTGYSFPEGDYRKLAAHICTLIENPELGKNMGQAGRQRMLDVFDIAKCTTKLENHYNELIDRNTTTGD